MERLSLKNVSSLVSSLGTSSFDRNNPSTVLITVMSAAILFPAGLFWLAWTSPSDFSVWVPMMAGLPFGIGLLAIFQGSMQYMIDAYGPFASSAVRRFFLLSRFRHCCALQPTLFKPTLLTRHKEKNVKIA